MAVDRYGDPLPPGAIARVGTVRFRQEHPFSALAFSPDGKMLASSGRDNIFRFWESTTGKELNQFGVQAGTVSSLAFSPDGKILAAGSKDGYILAWQASGGRQMLEFPAHQGQIHTLSFSADGKALLSGGSDGVVRAWEAASGRELREHPGEFGMFDAMSLSPDGKTLVLGNWESTLRLSDVASGKEFRHFRGPRGGIKCLAWSSDGRMLATGSIDTTICLCELTTGKERRQFPGHKDGTFCIAFSPDGKMLATGLGDTTILIWDVLGRTPEKKPGTVNLAPSQLDVLWTNLVDDDAAKAWQTICTLACAPGSSVPFLKGKLAALAPIDSIRIARMISEMDHDQFAVRERATLDLEKLGGLVEPNLSEARKGHPSLELRRRLDRLLDKLKEPTPAPETLRALRAVEALELASTKEALQVLDAIGRVTPESRLTREAKSSWERLAARMPGMH